MFSQSSPHPMLHMHSDVMNANPTDEEGKNRLFQEIKSRGNDAFKKKRLEEAELLYTRAIEILPNEFAIFGNRSAARCEMGKSALALEDAEKCIELNPEWVKGYFRRGQALMKLKQYDNAIKAFNLLLEKDPSNASGQKLLEKAKEAAKNAPKEKEVKPKQPKKVVRTEVVKENNKETTSSTASNNVINDEDNSSDKFRGYKKLANGRVTTYFNNELTDEARELIGDIAPKKVEGTESVQISAVEGGSAWNQGNTFEERSTTDWAKSRIKELLEGITIDINSQYSIRVTSIENLQGDASVAVMRGAKRYIYEFQFELKCQLLENGIKKQEGLLKILDMSSDAEIDLEAEVKDRHANDEVKLLYEYINSSEKGLQPILFEKANHFVKEFRSM